MGVEERDRVRVANGTSTDTISTVLSGRVNEARQMLKVPKNNLMII